MNFIFCIGLKCLDWKFSILCLEPYINALITTVLFVRPPVIVFPPVLDRCLRGYEFWFLLWVVDRTRLVTLSTSIVTISVQLYEMDIVLQSRILRSRR